MSAVAESGRDCHHPSVFFTRTHPSPAPSRDGCGSLNLLDQQDGFSTSIRPAQDWSCQSAPLRAQGKTSTMVARAAYAIHRGFVTPERIILLAFNKQAAEELKDRAAKSIDAWVVKIRPVLAVVNGLQAWSPAAHEIKYDGSCASSAMAIALALAMPARGGRR
jgi:hypothetical protein